LQNYYDQFKNTVFRNPAPVWFQKLGLFFSDGKGNIDADEQTFDGTLNERITKFTEQFMEVTR